MTIDEIKVHPTFVRLTEKQKNFVVGLCTNGNDKLKAAHAAYVCKNDATALAVASGLLAKETIKKLVDAFFSIEPSDECFSKDELLAFMTKKIRTSTTPDNIMAKLVDLYAELKGWKMKSVEAPDTSGSDVPTASTKGKQELVDDLVFAMETRHRKGE
jgi:hypothetical protein